MRRSDDLGSECPEIVVAEVVRKEDDDVWRARGGILGYGTRRDKQHQTGNGKSSHDAAIVLGGAD